MGDEAFLNLMRDYFRAHTTKTVTADSFLEQAGLTLYPRIWTKLTLPMAPPTWSTTSGDACRPP